MNPQLQFLKKISLLSPLINDIKDFLNKNNSLYTSHEILQGLSNENIIKLKAVLTNYENNGFAEPASHIGSICSYLVNEGTLEHEMKECSILNKIEDAFSIMNNSMEG